jgi:hypothetical protein
MPIIGQGWELHIQREKEQKRGSRRRTVGTYQVHHNGVAATGTIMVDGVAVPLSGTTAESKGPGQNDTPATNQNPSRILAGRYPLKTSGGPTYVTRGFRTDLQIKARMPGVELRKTDNRTDIIIHPGKDEFLSSIGCINPCTTLPNGSEDIDYGNSRRRVIALIEDMKQFLEEFPTDGDEPIVNAFVIIDGEPPAPGTTAAKAAAAAGSIDGRAVAEAHGVSIKNNNVKISNLHPKMEAVIAAVAEVASDMGLPKPVITSGNDSSHKHGSLHFSNRALDFRGNNITITNGRTLATRVATIVGGDYDVIFETFADKANNHLHAEFDPD